MANNDASMLYLFLLLRAQIKDYRAHALFYSGIHVHTTANMHYGNFPSQITCIPSLVKLLFQVDPVYAVMK